MKITAVKTYPVSVPTGQKPILDPKSGEKLYSTHKSWLFVKIETDAGIDGWGEGSGEWLTPYVEPSIKEMARLLIDRDPQDVVALCDDLANRVPWKNGPIYGTAIAGINMALYDIVGKAWGVPVYTILGGKRRDKVRVYSGGAFFDDPSTAGQIAKDVMALGFAGIKSNPLEGRTWPMDYPVIEHCVACVAAVREAVPDDFDILLDAHGSPTPEFSIEFARQVQPYHPLFLEEPCKVGSVEALMEVSRKSPVPIATGEKIFTPRDFLPLIQRRACAFLQPDLTHCYGITAAYEISRLAEESQMLMAPHQVSGPVCYGATLAVDTAINNFLIQESYHSIFEQFDKYAEHDWVIKDGYVNVSDRPGLGVEIKEADIAKSEYKPMDYRQYRHEDGSWKGW